MKLIFEKTQPTRRGVQFAKNDVGSCVNLKKELLRDSDAQLPEVSQLDVVRHFTELSRRNFGVDTNFYPLGSCTTKYNPKMTELIAGFEGFAEVHPLLPQLQGGGMLTQGALAVIYETDLLFREITGMASFTAQPMAGAHGELTGIMMIAAYHQKKGNTHKTTILIPDSSHGTNPSTAAVAGYKTKTVPSDENGVMNLDALKDAIDESVAGLMLTCPNTLGIFNPHIEEICDLVHSVDGITYYDGANLNAILGKVRPGDIGFDIVHLNVHAPHQLAGIRARAFGGGLDIDQLCIGAVAL